MKEGVVGNSVLLLPANEKWESSGGQLEPELLDLSTIVENRSFDARDSAAQPLRPDAD